MRRLSLAQHARPARPLPGSRRSSTRSSAPLPSIGEMLTCSDRLDALEGGCGPPQGAGEAWEDTAKRSMRLVEPAAAAAQPEAARPNHHRAHNCYGGLFAVMTTTETRGRLCCVRERVLLLLLLLLSRSTQVDAVCGQDTSQKIGANERWQRFSCAGRWCARVRCFCLPHERKRGKRA